MSIYSNVLKSTSKRLGLECQIEEIPALKNPYLGCVLQTIVFVATLALLFGLFFLSCQDEDRVEFHPVLSQKAVK